jgi:hypothetical protein
LPEEMSYEVFKSKIINLLKENMSGLTWTKIQQILDLPQTVPNNKWVRRLETETGLRREKDGGDTFWFLPTKGLAYTIGYEGKNITQFIKKLKLMAEHHRGSTRMKWLFGNHRIRVNKAVFNQR